MLAAGPIRWLLALLAMVSPSAAPCSASGDAVPGPGTDAHVVYRHYL